MPDVGPSRMGKNLSSWKILVLPQKRYVLHDEVEEIDERETKLMRRKEILFALMWTNKEASEHLKMYRFDHSLFCFLRLVCLLMRSLFSLLTWEIS